MHKRLFFIVILFAIMLNASDTFAQNDNNPAEQYNRAGALYRDGLFCESMALYEDIIARGIVNPDVYYNASNAAYRSGFLGKAILYNERALKLAPSDRETLENLAFLNNVKADNDMDNPNAVFAYLARHYNAINPNASSVWSCVSFALAMVMATIALFMVGVNRMVVLSVSLVLSVVFLSSTAILIHKIHRLKTVSEAIILSVEANAYSGPGTENTNIFVIHEGTKTVIERSQSDWNLIRLKSGAGGWIHSKHMEKI